MLINNLIIYYIMSTLKRIVDEKLSLSNKKGFSTFTAEELAERGVASNPAEHLSNGMFSVMPSDEVTDYMEAQWAEMVAGG